MKSVIPFIAGAVIFVLVGAFEILDSEAAPMQFTGAGTVEFKTALPLWSTAHRATWNWWPKWNELVQYWIQKTTWSYNTRSVAVPGTLLLFGAGFAGFVAWRNRLSHRKPSSTPSRISSIQDRVVKRASSEDTR